MDNTFNTGLWQHRLVEEKAKLDEDIEKLIEFRASFDAQRLTYTERNLLRRQAIAMQEYSDVLGERIELLSE